MQSCWMLQARLSISPKKPLLQPSMVLCCSSACHRVSLVGWILLRCPRPRGRLLCFVPLRQRRSHLAHTSPRSDQSLCLLAEGFNGATAGRMATWVCGDGLHLCCDAGMMAALE